MNVKLNFLLNIILIFTVTLSAQSLRTLHEKSFDVQPNQLLEIETDIGDIKVRTWERDEVFIKVYGNENAEEKVRFTFKETSNGVLVDAEVESGWNWFSNTRVRYEIDIPSNFNVDLSTAGGDVLLGDLKGEISLRTSGGDLEIINTVGKVYAKTSGGDVKVRNSIGDLELGTSGGDVNIESSNGSVSAKTSGGDIDLEYTGENYGIELATSGGDIMVYIPSDFEADVYLRTSGGDIETNMEAKIQEVSDDKFIGQMNGGGNELNCKTSGGDVIVKTY